MKQQRFRVVGKWREIIERGAAGAGSRSSDCSNVAMMHYVKAVAHRARKCREAETEKEQSIAAKARCRTAAVHNNKVVDLLGIAEEMLNGESRPQGQHRGGLRASAQSVERDDALPYDEPWARMQPTRHALGALLLEQGRTAEAEAVLPLRSGLDGKLSRACQHPDDLMVTARPPRMPRAPRREYRSRPDQAAARPRLGARRSPDQGVVLLPLDGDGGRVNFCQRCYRRFEKSATLGFRPFWASAVRQDLFTCRHRRGSADPSALPASEAGPRRDGRRALWYHYGLTNKGWQPMRVEIQYCGQ